MSIHRRQFVAGASAAALTAGLAGCGPQTGARQAASSSVPTTGAPKPLLDEVPDDLVETFLAESFNEGDPASRTSQEVTSWKELETTPGLMSRAKTVVEDVRDEELTAVVPADAESPDYVQFATPEFGKDGELATDTFKINDAVLRSLAEANGYTPALDLASKPIVLVGLRGCALPQGDKASASGTDIEVKEDKIDHVRRRCLVGVWDTGTGNIQVFSGSTVPNLVNMQYYIFWRFFLSGQAPPDQKWTDGKTMACLLPQGLHAYTVGVHLRNGGKDKYGNDRAQPGALLQSTPTPILRARRDVGYSIRDEWDPIDDTPPGEQSKVRLVGVNIHAGVNFNMPPYASKGCQTIFGWYKGGKTPEELWKDFQTSLGISLSWDDAGAVKFTREKDTFQYVLTTGREARLHAAAAGNPTALASLKRIRLGTQGPMAAALRQFLKRPAGDVVDGETLEALLRWQKANDLPRDAMVTPKLSTDWKINAI